MRAQWECYEQRGGSPPSWYPLDDVASGRLSQAHHARDSEVTARDSSSTSFLRQMVVHRHADGTFLPLRCDGMRQPLTPRYWAPQLENEAALHEVPRFSDEVRRRGFTSSLTKSTSVSTTTTTAVLLVRATHSHPRHIHAYPPSTRSPTHAVQVRRRGVCSAKSDTSNRPS